jgi:hypothetical protein
MVISLTMSLVFSGSTFDSLLFSVFTFNVSFTTSATALSALDVPFVGFSTVPFVFVICFAPALETFFGFWLAWLIEIYARSKTGMKILEQRFRS